MVSASTFRPRIGAMEIAIVAMSTTIYTVLGTLAAGFYIVPGVTVFYLPEAFIMAASMWFGVWGCLGAFFGSILFGPFVGIGYLIGLEFGLPNMSSSIVAGLVLRKLRMDLSLKDKKSLALWLLFAAGLGPLVEAVVGLPVYVFNGWYTWEFAYTWGLAVWLIGDVTAVAVVGTILMRVLSKYMIKTALFHKGFIHREIVTEH